MKFLYDIMTFLQKEMIEPMAFGWFHWLCILCMLSAIFFLYKIKNQHSEKQLKTILGIYGGVVLTLEALKQISWAVSFNHEMGIFVWDYEWYAFPFQLCTTPMFVSIFCVFLKKGKVRDFLLSYMAFTTILGSIATILMPDSCLVNDVLVNVHTMWLHLGSFVVSVYLLMSGEVKISKESWLQSVPIFLCFATLANALNIIVYNLDVLNGETFNMFYISPYFISDLPVFDKIQQNTPYIIFILSYIFVIIFGSFIILQISKLLSTIHNKLTTVNHQKHIAHRNT
jgi:hypothetical protein